MSSLPHGLAFEGKGADKRIVAVTMPPDHHFGEPPEPEPLPAISADRAELLGQIFSLFDCPEKNYGARVAALKICGGRDDRPLRRVSKRLGISVGTLHSNVSMIREKFKLRGSRIEQNLRGKCPRN
jgi:hypothetical protein